MAASMRSTLAAPAAPTTPQIPLMARRALRPWSRGRNLGEVKREIDRSLLLPIAGLALVGAAALFVWRARSERFGLEAISVAQSRLDPAGSVSRAANPELTLNAVLAHAPRDDRVELSCDFKDESGTVRYQKHWQTKPIDRDLWPTHCRQRFSSSDPAGHWSVTMKQEQRPLTTVEFTLE